MLKTILRISLFTFFASAISIAHAMSGDAHKAELKRIKDDYRAAIEKCRPLGGNEKEVCIQQAKADNKKAKADLEAADDGTQKARSAADEHKDAADFTVDKEKCDAFSGNAKDVCMAEAKAKLEKSRAGRKAADKGSKASEDARAANRKADYTVAKEKCDALSGDARDDCVKNAKLRYKKQP